MPKYGSMREYYEQREARFVGNFLADAQPLLEQAIKESSLPLSVRDVAAVRGRIMPGKISIWMKGDKSPAQFWKAYRRLKAEEAGK